MDYLKDYIHFQKNSPTPFHAVDWVSAKLEENKFEKLDPSSPWKLKQNGKYYVEHPDAKASIAFVCGKKSPYDGGFRIIGSHTDSPNLQLRLDPLSESNELCILKTQYHGGAIFRSWLDRPLILAGAVYEDAGGSIKRHLVSTKQPIAVIPDIAIHLDRDKNKSGEINPQTALNAVISTGSERDDVLKQLERFLKFDFDKVLGFELSLAPFEEPRIVGVDRSMLTCPRHDDLCMVYCSLQSLLEVSKAKKIENNLVAAFFNDEETGSESPSGARSSFITQTLDRISNAHANSRAGDHFQQVQSNSFFVSADMAHALHPGYPEKHDHDHAPRLNAGVVIKANSNQRYATDGLGVALMQKLARDNDVPLQNFVNRQDLGCGSTIGPAVGAALSVPTVDLGLAMYAMHSTFETMGVHDLDHAVALFNAFYSFDQELIKGISQN